MSGVLAKVSQSGRLGIPAKFRKAVGLERGGEVVIELDGRQIRIRTVDDVVSRAQAPTRRPLGEKPDASVDAFLAEREARRERRLRFLNASALLTLPRMCVANPPRPASRAMAIKRSTA